MSLARRCGRAQLFAFLLLLAFLLQALWVARLRPLTRVEAAYVEVGLDQFRGELVDPNVPTVPTALAAFPVLLSRQPPENIPPEILKWLVRVPFIAVGWLLGASVWYVSRRLCGNAGGYLALALYCFSPLVFFAFPSPIVTSSLGAFGMIFVGIAAAHTLYAPSRAANPDHPLAGLADLRTRWRRIILLGLATALGVGSHYWLVFLLILAEAFMVYIVPERQFSAVGLVLASCAVAFLVLWALHGFHWHMYWSALRHATWLPRPDHRLFTGAALRGFAAEMSRTGRVPTTVLFLLALVTYLGYKRARYFGNTAPLLVAIFLMLFALLTLTGVYAGPFPLQSLPFLFVFIAGIFADLLESDWRAYALAFTIVMLGIYVAASLIEIAGTRFSVLY